MNKGDYSLYNTNATCLELSYNMFCSGSVKVIETTRQIALGRHYLPIVAEVNYPTYILPSLVAPQLRFCIYHMTSFIRIPESPCYGNSSHPPP